MSTDPHEIWVNTPLGAVMSGTMPPTNDSDLLSRYKHTRCAYCRHACSEYGHYPAIANGCLVICGNCWASAPRQVRDFIEQNTRARARTRLIVP